MKYVAEQQARDYGNHAQRNTWGFMSPGRTEPEYEGRHRMYSWWTSDYIFSVPGILRRVWADG